MQTPLKSDLKTKGKVVYMSRSATVTRTTKETDISMTFTIDGTGTSHIDTGIGFFNHMLEGFAKHGFFDLDLSIKGDLQVDGHHTVEDAGIVLGTAIKEAVGDKAGIKRYGSFILPMDDALALCAEDPTLPLTVILQQREWAIWKPSLCGNSFMQCPTQPV